MGKDKFAYKLLENQFASNSFIIMKSAVGERNKPPLACRNFFIRKEAKMAKKKKKKSIKMMVAGYFGRLCFGSWLRTGVTLFAGSIWAASQWPSEPVFTQLAQVIILLAILAWMVKKFATVLGEFFKI